MISGENTTGTKLMAVRYAPAAVVLLVFAAVFPTAAYGNASVFVNTGVASCGAYGFCQNASLFGMLIGPGDAATITGTTTLLNDVAVKSGATLTTSGTVNIGNSTNASIVDFADSLTGAPTTPTCTGSGCKPSTGSSFSTGTKVWGSTASAAATVNSAYTQFQDLAAYWNSTTSIGAPSTSATWNITPTASHINVYKATGSLSLTSQTIGCSTTPCPTDELIIILVTGTMSVTGNLNFAAGSGLTDDQLLYVINATGSSGTPALQIGPSSKNTSRTVHGDFFVPNGNFTLGSALNGTAVDFYGRVFANATAVGANADAINAGVTLENEGAVPEPSTWVGMAGGLGALIFVQRRRKKNADLPS